MFDRKEPDFVLTKIGKLHYRLRTRCWRFFAYHLCKVVTKLLYCLFQAMKQSSSGFSATTVFIFSAAAIWLGARQFADQDRVGATDPCSNGNGVCRTVHGTSPAFHTSIFIDHMRNALMDNEYFMRTNLKTQTATDAFHIVNLKGCHIIQVLMSHSHSHCLSKHSRFHPPKIIKMNPTAILIIIKGIAYFISFCTPDNEV
jgi:hypothetical protein